MSWDELPPLMSWATFPRANSSGSLPPLAPSRTNHSAASEEEEDGSEAPGESLAQRTVPATSPADLRICHDNMRRLMFDVESQASPSVVGVKRFEPDTWFAEQRQEQHQQVATPIDELIEGLGSSLGQTREKATFDPSSGTSSLTSTLRRGPPTASMKSVRIDLDRPPTQSVTFREDAQMYDDEPPTGPPVRSLISLTTAGEEVVAIKTRSMSYTASVKGKSELEPENGSSSQNGGGVQRSATGASLQRAMSLQVSQSRTSSLGKQSLDLDTPMDWASLWAWENQEVAPKPSSESETENRLKPPDLENRPMTVASLLSPQNWSGLRSSFRMPSPATPFGRAATPSGRIATPSGRITTPSGRIATPFGSSGGSLRTGVRRWFTVIGNVWPVLWLPLEIVLHYSTIIGSLWAIWAKEDWEESKVLEFLFQSHTLPSEKVLALMIFWMVMAGHAIRRNHAAIRCYKRIRLCVKTRRMALLLAVREGTWVALEAADRTEALRLIKTDNEASDFVSEVGCCFRYWCLSCWCCCFHKRFLQPIFRSAVKTVSHEEKQAYVTMWELVAGMWSRVPDTGFYQAVMRALSFLAVLASPFLGAPTYHWPETLWLWKMMFWRAAVDIVFFAVFIQDDCYHLAAQAIKREVGGRRLSSPAGASWPSTMPAPTFPQGVMVGWQSSSHWGEDLACNWHLGSASTFVSHGGSAVLTKGDGCQFSVSLQLDPNFNHGVLYQSIIDQYNGSYNIYGWGVATNFTFQVDFGVPWYGAVLANGDFIAYGESVNEFSVFSQSTEAEGCADITGAWYSADNYYGRIAVYDQEGCDVQFLNPNELTLERYPMALQGQSFSVRISQSEYRHGHLWTNGTLLVYSNDFNVLSVYHLQEAVNCDFCATDGTYFYPDIMLPDFRDFSCGTAQTVINLGMENCDFWRTRGFMTFDALSEECCRSHTMCSNAPWLSVRLFLGVATLINLFWKYRYYRRYWNPRLAGTITNYWGRKDFWEKWVSSVEPVPFDWKTPIDLWAEYERLERRSQVRRQIHAGADFLPQSLAEVNIETPL